MESTFVAVGDGTRCVWAETRRGEKRQREVVKRQESTGAWEPNQETSLEPGSGIILEAWFVLESWKREPADHKKEKRSRVWTGFVEGEWLEKLVLGGMGGETTQGTGIGRTTSQWRFFSAEGYCRRRRQRQT